MTANCSRSYTAHTAAAAEMAQLQEVDAEPGHPCHILIPAAAAVISRKCSFPAVSQPHIYIFDLQSNQHLPTYTKDIGNQL